jgi:hypothetical protein
MFFLVIAALLTTASEGQPQGGCPYKSVSLFAHFAFFAAIFRIRILYYVTFVPFVVNSLLRFWLRLCRARLFAVKFLSSLIIRPAARETPRRLCRSS